jgi:hypothetical protein
MLQLMLESECSDLSSGRHVSSSLSLSLVESHTDKKGTKKEGEKRRKGLKGRRKIEDMNQFRL